MDRSLCACVRAGACLRVVCPALRTVFWGLWCLQNLGGVDVKQTGELAMPLFFFVSNNITKMLDHVADRS